MSFIFSYLREHERVFSSGIKNTCSSGPIDGGYSEGHSWLVCRVGVGRMWEDINFRKALDTVPTLQNGLMIGQINTHYRDISLGHADTKALKRVLYLVCLARTVISTSIPIPNLFLFAQSWDKSKFCANL